MDRPRLGLGPAPRSQPPRARQLSLFADEPAPAPGPKAPPARKAPRRRSADYVAGDEFESAILRGDRDAVSRVLYRIAGRVVGMKAATLPPTLDPDDLVQLAVVEALGRLDRWEPGRSSAFSYATGSVKFTILAEGKRERRWLEVNRQVAGDEGDLDRKADPRGD